MRRPKACVTCRSRRRKCVLQPGHAVCDYCQLNGSDCVHELPRGGWYEQRAKRQRSGSQSHSRRPHEEGESSSIGASDGRGGGSSYRASTADEPLRLPDLEHLLAITHLYFDYIHDVFHSLFHRATFVQDLMQGQVAEAIMFAICGLAVRFYDSPAFAEVEARDRGRIYMDEAERRFNMKNISLENVQLAMLLAAGSLADGHMDAENVYHTVACRIAQLVGLPRLAGSTPLERETSLRIWWSLCRVDVWVCAASKVPRVLPDDGHGAPLPMDDLDYQYLQRITHEYDRDNRLPAAAVTSPRSTNTPTTTSTSASPPGPPPVFERRSPLTAEMIKLNRILLEIHDFNQQCVGDTLSSIEAENGVQTLSHRMDAWLTALPAEVRDTADNFNWYNAHGLGRNFAAVYLGYYHFGQLLYYQFLHRGNSAPPGSPACVYSDRCKRHSAQLCDMIYRAVFTPGSDVRYFMVAHVVVIASTVQIHTLLFSDDERQIADARRRLSKNFEILLLLRPYWPALDHCMARLRAFHRTCRVNMSTSFVLDGWMLQFLVAFGDIEEGMMAASRPELERFYTLDDLMS